ncbi:MAG: hypothetical protein ABSD52_12720 [Candidatus Cybelea sp.]|jgi:hypothetical protein
MSKSIFALALALSLIPAAALAQDTNASQQPTDAQRQQMHQMFEQFGQQERQLHDQLRSQILSVLTPVHRRALAAEIGNLVLSPNPDIDAAAKQIDAILSPSERQRILQAHAAYASQSRQLHEQMKSQMQSEMPNWHPPSHDDHMMNSSMQAQMRDPGWILLRSLPPHEHDNMGMGDHGAMGSPPMGGAPPPAP